MRIIQRRWLIAAWLIAGASAACAGSLGSANNPDCPAGRTALDGVCVADDIADYVGCVRAQGAKLDADTSKRLSAEAGAAGAKVGAVVELSDRLSKQYSASDATIQTIIETCGAMRTARAPDPCVSAAQRMLECRFEADPSWLAVCQSDPAYSTCLGEKLASCDGLALCGFARYSRGQCEEKQTAAIGTGTAGCEATLSCQGSCAGDPGCACSCNSRMASGAARAVAVQNQCFQRNCAACGAPGSQACNECFTKACAPGFSELCERR